MAARPDEIAARTERWWLLPLTILAVGLVAAVVLFVAGVIHSGNLGLELAKGGIQLLVVVILGSAVAFGFRNLDERRVDQRRREDVAREDRRRIDDYRVTFVAELWRSYHRVKAVRRTLNAYGFGSSSGVFSEEECREYDTQMKELDDAQLTLETLKRNVQEDRTRQLFGRQQEAIAELLEEAERYVNHVIGDWEDNREQVKPDRDKAQALASQRYLREFLGTARGEGGMKQALSQPVGDAVRLVQELRFTP